MLRDNGADKKEISLTYRDKDRLKEEVIRMNKVLDHVKITGITHCRNVIEAVTKIVGKEFEA